VRAPQSGRGWCQREDAVVHLRRRRVVAEASLQLQDRQRQPRQQYVTGLVVEVIAQQQQARTHGGFAAINVRWRGGIDAENAVQRCGQDGRVGLTGIGNASHLLQRLHQAG